MPSAVNRSLLALTLLALTLTAWSSSSHAGGLSVGAAYSCNIDDGLFVLVATADIDEDPGVGAAPVGFTTIGNEDTAIECDLPRASIQTQLRVWPPMPQGMCHGIGVINFSGVRVNGRLEVKRDPFGDGCFDGRSVLARIE